MIVNRQSALNEIKRVLKPGGRLIVGEELPEPEYVRPKSVKKWTERAGFSMTGKSGNAFAYLLQFVKPLPIVDQAEDAASAG
jgi:ubiquinone/menaquinone biosynthesis C-methylase UbiE